MKHSQGKWLAVWGKNGLTIQIATIGAPKTVASITCDNYKKDAVVKKSEANARLIAAAPEMLELLKEYLQGKVNGISRSTVINLINHIEREA